MTHYLGPLPRMKGDQTLCSNHDARTVFVQLGAHWLIAMCRKVRWHAQCLIPSAESARRLQLSLCERVRWLVGERGAATPIRPRGERADAIALCAIHRLVRLAQELVDGGRRRRGA